MRYFFSETTSWSCAHVNEKKAKKVNNKPISVKRDAFETIAQLEILIQYKWTVEAVYKNFVIYSRTFIDFVFDL